MDGQSSEGKDLRIRTSCRHVPIKHRSWQLPREASAAAGSCQSGGGSAEASEAGENARMADHCGLGPGSPPEDDETPRISSPFKTSRPSMSESVRALKRKEREGGSALKR